MKKISRRTFVKISGILGASLLVAPKWLIAETIYYQPRHQVIYASSLQGNDLYSGASWERSVKTLSEATKRVLPGGKIYVCPEHREVSKSGIVFSKSCAILKGK